MIYYLKVYYYGLKLIEIVIPGIFSRTQSYSPGTLPTDRGVNTVLLPPRRLPRSRYLSPQFLIVTDTVACYNRLQPERTSTRTNRYQTQLLLTGILNLSIRLLLNLLENQPRFVLSSRGYLVSKLYRFRF